MEAGTADLTDLRDRLSGELVVPGDAAYDEARLAWNLAVDQHPAAVARVASADDVVAVVDFARAEGLEVAPQGTGHGAAARGELSGAILLRTERLDSIEVDPEAGVARFGAGVIWRDGLAAAAEHGLAGPSGSSPDVGVVGYATGGGFGWLARRHGLACNRVRAFEVVTADGQRRRVDAGSEPDLFWAMRGGGGAFALVTAIEFDLVPLPEVFAGSVIYPAGEAEDARRVFHAWRQWAATTPDEVTSIARFLHLPPLPEVPEPLRDRPVITLGAAYAGDPTEGEEAIAPLRALGEPVMDLFERMSPAGLCTIHLDPEEPVPALTHTGMLRELSADAVDAFVDVAGPGSGSPLLVAEIRQAGGAAGRPAPGAGALSHLDAAAVVLGVGLPMTPELGAAIEGHLDRLVEALGPWSTGSAYFNFADRPTAPGDLFAPEALARLLEVRESFDPGGMIRSNHPLERSLA